MREYAEFIIFQVEDTLLDGDTDAMPVVRTFAHLMTDLAVTADGKKQALEIWAEFGNRIETMHTTYAGSEAIKDYMFVEIKDFIRTHEGSLKKVKHG